MFGRSSSSNDKFVMAMGKKAGNIKTARAAPAGAGKQTVRKAPPAKKVTDKGAGKLKPADKMSRGVEVYENKPQPLGKANTFNTSKRVPR